MNTQTMTRLICGVSLAMLLGCDQYRDFFETLGILDEAAPEQEEEMSPADEPEPKKVAKVVKADKAPATAPPTPDKVYSAGVPDLMFILVRRPPIHTIIPLKSLFLSRSNL